jgi:uncharacterized membrane protein
VSLFDWLLVLHITGAFLLIGGITTAGILNLAALGRERPSEIVLLYRLIQKAVVAIIVGLLLLLVIGLWLVHESHFGYGDGWIVAAIVLWVLGTVLGNLGGREETKTRQLAERLAAEGDAPSEELRARIRNPLTLALSYGSGVVAIVVLALMIWKPGS